MMLDDMDLEAFMNLRDWVQKALEDAGGEIIDSGMGAGKADLGLQLEGYDYSISMRPRTRSKQCHICHGSGKIPHPISGETKGPVIDAERAQWAKFLPVDCPICGGSGEEPS